MSEELRVCQKHNVTFEGFCPECRNEEAQLDEMIESTSTPNLASLFKKAKKKGLIKATQEYTSA